MFSVGGFTASILKIDYLNGVYRPDDRTGYGSQIAGFTSPALGRGKRSPGWPRVPLVCCYYIGRVKRRRVFWAAAGTGVLVPTHANNEAVGMDGAPEQCG